VLVEQIRSKELIEGVEVSSVEAVQGFLSLELWEARKQNRQNHQMIPIDHESAKTR